MKVYIASVYQRDYGNGSKHYAESFEIAGVFSKKESADEYARSIKEYTNLIRDNDEKVQWEFHGKCSYCDGYFYSHDSETDYCLYGMYVIIKEFEVM